MKKMRRLEDLQPSGKKVLLRADFNVPLMSEGSDKNSDAVKIRDDLRIRAAIPTIKWLLENKASKVIAMSHLGSPKGYDKSLSLLPVAKRLEELLGEKVLFAEDCIGEKAQTAAFSNTARIVVLENLRFHPGEKNIEKESEFVKQLASLGDLYVNDAFGTAHRTDSSCVALALAFKSRAAAGFLLAKEVDFLKSQFENPKRPFVAIIGGAKISSKLGILKQILEKCDKLAIIGAMASTFLLAKGYSVGSSLCEVNFKSQALEILERAKKLGKPILLPSDLLVASSLESSSFVRLVPGHLIPENFMSVDIGEKTLRDLNELLNGAKTIFWNGPAGIFEDPRFAKGTQALAQILATHKATTIIGGGDSSAAVAQMGLESRLDHVSTGGGASLELIEKGDLPALEALRSAY